MSNVSPAERALRAGSADEPAGPAPRETAVSTPRRRRLSSEKMIFFGPILVILVGIIGFPIGFALYASFADVDNLFSLNFAGLVNYQHLLDRPEDLLTPFVNTVRFVVVSVAASLVIGFGGALLLTSKIRGRRWIRSALMFPWVIPSVLVALLWRWIMDPAAGAFNGLLQAMGIIDEPVSWLGEPSLAPWIIILAQVWHGFPFIMVMLMAALQTIPEELYEAASMDGAGGFRKLVSITWPSIRPIVILVATLEGLYAFREFATIDVLTGGGPAGSTEVLATQVYRLFFNYHKFGESLALASLMFVLAFVVTLFSMKLSARSEED